MKTKAKIICWKVYVRPDNIKLNILFAFNEGEGKNFRMKKKEKRRMIANRDGKSKR